MRQRARAHSTVLFRAEPERPAKVEVVAKVDVAKVDVAKVAKEERYPKEGYQLHKGVGCIEPPRQQSGESPAGTTPFTVGQRLSGPSLLIWKRPRQPISRETWCQKPRRQSEESDTKSCAKSAGVASTW